MKNTFGNNFAVTISGESHGGGICVIIDGVPPGIAIDRKLKKAKTRKRDQCLADLLFCLKLTAQIDRRARGFPTE